MLPSGPKLGLLIIWHQTCLFVCFWSYSSRWARASAFTWILDHTQRSTTVGRNHLDEWSARRRDLYLTRHNIQNRQISMPPVGIEPTISARERPQTYALDPATTGNGRLCPAEVIQRSCWTNFRGYPWQFEASELAKGFLKEWVLFYAYIDIPYLFQAKMTA